MYDPSTGKFLSVDPLSFASGDTDLTRYVGNEVTALVDPTGLLPIDPVKEAQMKKLLAQMKQEALAQKQAAMMLLWTYQAMQLQQPGGQLTGKAPAKPVIPSVIANKQAQAAFQQKIADAMKNMSQQEAANQLKLLAAAKIATQKAYNAAILETLQGQNAVQAQIKKTDAQYKLKMLEMAEAAAKANKPN